MTTRWQDRRPAYRLRTESAVRSVVRRATRDLMAWYRQHYPPAHYVVVYVCDCRRIVDPTDRGFARGLFWAPHAPATSPQPPTIWVAGAHAVGDVLHSLAHELAHYDEWRRTGRITESGKRLAAARLVTQFCREHGGWRERARSAPPGGR